MKDSDDLDKEIKTFWNIPKNEILDLSFLDTYKNKLEYRTSQAFEDKFNENNALIWYQMALNFVRNVKAKPFNKDHLIQLMNETHLYTKNENGIRKFLNELTAVGVKFVFLSHLSKTYLDGAAFLSNSGPVVALTGRFDRIDNFWFTLAHELSHVIFHLGTNGADSIFVDDTTKKSISVKEVEANQNAEQILLQNEILSFFGDSTNYITDEKVREFAEAYDIHASIVVGILIHNEQASYPTLHRFKDSVRDKIPDKFKADPWNYF